MAKTKEKAICPTIEWLYSHKDELSFTNELLGDILVGLLITSYLIKVHINKYKTI